MRLLTIIIFFLGGCSNPHKNSENSLNLFHGFEDGAYLWNTKTHNPYVHKIDSLGEQTVIFIPLDSGDKEYLRHFEIYSSIYSQYDELKDLYYFTQLQLNEVSVLLKNRTKAKEKFNMKGVFIPARYIAKETSLEDSYTLTYPYKKYIYKFSVNDWTLTDSLEINNYVEDSIATAQIEEVSPLSKDSSGKKYDALIPAPLKIWKLECVNNSALFKSDEKFNFGYLDFYTRGEFASIVVSPKIQNGFYILTFEALSGITLNNTEMDWNQFSRDSAIAVVCTNGNLMKFQWLGFYDKVLQKRVFLTGPFESSRTLINLKNCE